MATTTPAAFMAAKALRLKAIAPGGVESFQFVGRCIELDIEMIKKIPNTPCALLANLGGELQSANDAKWTKRMAVHVVCRSYSDVISDELAEKLDLWSELVISELQSDRRDSGIFCTYQSEDAQIKDEEAAFAVRSLIFEYKIDRTVA